MEGEVGDGFLYHMSVNSHGYGKEQQSTNNII